MAGRFDTRIGPSAPSRGRAQLGTGAFYQRLATKDASRAMAEIVQRYEQLIRKLEGATPTFLHNAIRPVRNKAAIYVPKDTGALAASENVLVTTNERGNPMISLTYGDQTAWYAALVHEFVWLSHESPTRSKYLQAALEEEMDSFLVSLVADYATML